MKIKRNANPKAGPIDGVEAATNCVVTKFERVNKKRNIKQQDVMPCRITCAFSQGVIGISVRLMDVMVSIPIDDITEVIKMAAESHTEHFTREDTP
jgi:hypothetical protein